MTRRLADAALPHSLEAEAALLGAAIIDHRVLDDVLMLVPSGDRFYAEAHGAVWEALRSIHARGRGGDLVVLVDALRGAGTLDAIGGPDALVRLAEQTPSAAAAPMYAKIVASKHAMRSMIAACTEAIDDCRTGGGTPDADLEVLSRCEGMVFAAAEASNRAQAGADTESIGLMLDRTMAALEANEGRAVTGIATGFPDLDEMLSGFQPGEMVVIAARPSMGKTAMALTLCEQVAFAGLSCDPAASGPECPAAFFSMEMGRLAVAQRLLCARAGVGSQDLRKGRVSAADKDRLRTAAKALSLAPITIDDTPTLTIQALRSRCRRLVRDGCRCFFVDYLQLMTDPGSARESRQQEVSSISRGIKAIARELGVPMVCLAQLNRGAESREGNRPRMADLRESGSIEQDADVIMLLHREAYYRGHDEQWKRENPEKIHAAELIVAKQRNGPTGSVNLTWDADCTRFRPGMDPRLARAKYADPSGDMSTDDLPV